MPAAEDLNRGRELFGRRAWAESYRLLEAADRDTPLEPEDLECLARAAYLIGHDTQCESAIGRAHQAFLNRGDHEGGARCAFWLGFTLLGRGALAPGSAWMARAGRLIEEARLESVVQGYLLVPVAIGRITQGDAAAAHEAFTQAAAIADRFADRDLSALACHGRGRALIRMGNVHEGIALLDQAMVAVVAGDVSAILAGDIYCSVLEACHEIFDLRRAYEWTTSFAEWCASQPDLVRFRGECLIYRAEILQLRGAWVDAERGRPARRATLLSSPARRRRPARLSTGWRRSIGFAVSSRKPKRPIDRRTRVAAAATRSSLLRLSQGHPIWPLRRSVAS